MIYPVVYVFRCRYVYVWRECVFVCTLHFSFMSLKIHIESACRNGLQDALDKPIDILHIRITINILAGVIFTFLFSPCLRMPFEFGRCSTLCYLYTQSHHYSVVISESIFPKMKIHIVLFHANPHTHTHTIAYINVHDAYLSHCRQCFVDSKKRDTDRKHTQDPEFYVKTLRFRVIHVYARDCGSV